MNAIRLHIILVFISSFALSTALDGQTHRANKNLSALEKLESDAYERLNLYWILTEEYIWINRDSAVYFARQGYDLAQRVGKQEDLAAFLERMSYSYVASERLDSFQLFGEKSLQAFTELKNERGMAQAHLALGYGKRMKGDREEAQNHFLEALKKGEAIGDDKIIGDANYHIMGLFFFQEQQSHSHEYGFKAIEAYKRIEDNLHLGKTYQFLGNVYRRIPDYDEARKYYEMGEALLESIYCPALKSILYLNYSLFFMEINDTPEVERTVKLAEQNADLGAFPIIKILAWGNLGEFYAMNGHYQKSIDILKIAVANNTDPVASYEFTHFLAGAYEAINQPDSAYKYEKIAYKNYQENIELTGIQQVREMQTKYETEKKEAQINIQNQKLARQRLIQWFGAGFMALMGIIGFLLFRAYKTKQRTNEKLAELDEQKNKMYANISHEFRTPLTVISGMIEESKIIDDKKLTIQRNTNKLLRLVNQMLDLSKLDNQVMEINYVHNDMIKYLGYLTQSFQTLAEAKKIDLNLESNVRELYMDFDPDKIQDIISNLLSNAIKFTKPGGKIRIRADKHKNDASEQLFIEVQDSGVGIAPSDQKKIFDRYFQVYSQKEDGTSHPNVQDHEGTGIGLSLVRELVELLDGKISLSSNPGEGTTFKLILPVLSNAKPLVSATDGTAKTISPAENLTDRPMLLLVEDNTDVRDYITSILQEKYQLLLAENGQQGIDIALEQVPDIIISDVMMPIKDGYTLTQTLKSNECSSHIPIILLTAMADEESKLAGLDYGADAYLTKPFKKEELFARLKNMMTLRKNIQARFSQLAQHNHEGDIEDNSPNKIEHEFLLKLRKTVEDHLSDSSFSPTQLSETVFLSSTQVYRKLKALTNKTPSQFIRSIRLQHAMEMIKTRDLNISQIAFEVGFNDLAYFSRQFSKEFGISPKKVSQKK